MVQRQTIGAGFSEGSQLKVGQTEVHCPELVFLNCGWSTSSGLAAFRRETFFFLLSFRHCRSFSFLLLPFLFSSFFSSCHDLTASLFLPPPITISGSLLYLCYLHCHLRHFSLSPSLQGDRRTVKLSPYVGWSCCLIHKVLFSAGGQERFLPLRDRARATARE